jgi:magnesium-transporting ATPase (P-type)
MLHAYSAKPHKSFDMTSTDQASLGQGLSGAEAAARLDRFGPNQIRLKRQRLIVLEFLVRLRNPLVLILLAASGANLRIVPKVEAAMKLVPSANEFDHFQQASWLIQNPNALDATRHAEAFGRFEQLFVALNALLT